MAFLNKALDPSQREVERDCLRYAVRSPAVWPRVGIVVEDRYLKQAQPAGLAAALGARGHHVVLIDPLAHAQEVGNDRWLEGLDAIVGRGRSWGVLSLLRWAEIRKVPTINRRAAIAAVHNKAEMAVTLATGGIPTPRTWLAPVAHLARTVSDEEYPVILKPIFGDNCQGLRVVRTRAELTSVRWPEPVALAQRFVVGAHRDLKLYGIGERQWAVRKPSPLLTPWSAGAPSADKESDVELVEPLPPAWRELALRCRNLFELDLYGVDCLETPDGPLVIEVNEFPNYTGVPHVSETLADYAVSMIRSRSTRQAS